MSGQRWTVGDLVRVGGWSAGVVVEDTVDGFAVLNMAGVRLEGVAAGRLSRWVPTNGQRSRLFGLLAARSVDRDRVLDAIDG